jgi:anti-repressor protein
VSLPALTSHIFENKPVRVTTDENGDPWFVAVDVCRILELDNVTAALRILDADEKGLTTNKTPGGDQSVNSISEPGLYKLLGRSRRPEAKRFDRWVRHEVLPSIRKNGSYSVPLTREQQLANAVLLSQDIIKEQAEQISVMEPKADFYDKFADADGLYGLQNAARVLGQPPNKFIGKLKQEHLFYQGTALVPRVQFTKQGLFEVKTEIVNDKARPQTFMTPKGVQYFAKKFGISLATGEMH